MALRTQIFPPSPTFTESSLPSLSSRVYIITGATSGVGLELAKILYSRSATVYIAARNSAKIATAISTIGDSAPGSTGKLESLVGDLSDLQGVGPAAKTFAARETRLDGLVLNAGVMTPPEGTKSMQGYEVQMATNSLGGYLLMRCLEESLANTVKVAGKNSVRVVWVSSNVHMATPEGGIIWDEDKDEPRVVKNQMDNYMMSKVGNIFLAHETAERLGKQGVISVSVNPGLMKTELQRHIPSLISMAMGAVFKSPKFGAYSELFGLLSPEVTAERNGAFLFPWGRFGCIPENINLGMKSQREGGTGLSKRFIEWCEKETSAFR